MASTSRPARTAATMRAPSVGSPSTIHRSRSRFRNASLHRTPHSKRRLNPASAAGSTGRPSALTVPLGSNPSPLTSHDRAPATRIRTFISPFVSVPVLSEQMTLEAVELLLERRLLLRLLLDEAGDLAELRRHSGLDDNRLPAASFDRGPHEHHVLPVADERVPR